MAKPAGSAKVEPMSITFKEGWTHPPMQPPRIYSPRVEAAIEMEIVTLSEDTESSLSDRKGESSVRMDEDADGVSETPGDQERGSPVRMDEDTDCVSEIPGDRKGGSLVRWDEDTDSESETPMGSLVRRDEDTDSESETPMSFDQE